MIKVGLAGLKKHGSTALFIWAVSPVPVGIVLGVIRAFAGMPDWLFFGLVMLSLAPIAAAFAALGLAIMFCGFFIRPALGRIAYLVFIAFCILAGDDEALTGRNLWMLGAACVFWMSYWLIFDAVWPVVERMEWWQRRKRRRMPAP